MAEQTFRAPSFYEREIDLSAPAVGGPSGIPAAVIGTSLKGPAFVPVTVANFDEFSGVFGGLAISKNGTYCANEYLKHRSALTYIRVLGAGSNETEAHVNNTLATGRVTNAGVVISGTAALNEGRHNGSVQFLCAKHVLSSVEAVGYPMFTDNNSYSGSEVNLVRGVLLLASGSRAMVLNGDETAVGVNWSTTDDVATVNTSNKFKLIISSTLGNTFNNTDGHAGVKIFTASLDPSNADYFGKLLNQDPDRFVEDQHMLYMDLAVDAELASASIVGILSGSSNTSSTSGDTGMLFRNAFGTYDTRYQSPKTTWFVSQPFGKTEYDLFYFEAIDDGEYANTLYKTTITNLKASTDESNLYGSFSVQIRDFNDTDLNPIVLEQFNNCNLNPLSENYIAKVIGDRKVYFNFDTTSEDERRLVTSGKYNNTSKYVRVITSTNVERSLVPQNTLPFGFRGVNYLKTNNLLADSTSGLAAAETRLAGVLGLGVATSLSGAILPPIPFRFKATKGEVSSTGTWPGEPGTTEVASSQYCWGIKFERNTNVLNTNSVTEKNKLLANVSKFMGIQKLDTLLTGSGADTLNDNKFTLAKVALSNQSTADLTGSLSSHMKEAAYIRDAVLDQTNYTINDGVLTSRVTLATILANLTAAEFNRFSPYTKFTNMLFGGYDGTNFLDKDARKMNDKSTSMDTGGSALSTYVAPGLTTNPAGSGQQNSTILSYKTAINIITDPQVSIANLISIPGIKETFLTDYALRKTRDYGKAMYVIDIPSYDDDSNRLYDDSVAKPSVEKTAATFEARNIDNSYGSAYWPNITVNDDKNKRKVKVPASCAAYGALAFNDRVAYPWFAPAGYNRAALDFVSNVDVRLNVDHRNILSDSRINPIAVFPKLGYVIYGQKTLQINQTALNRVNVRRLMLEVKRIIVDIANRLAFEQNNVETRNKFVSDSSLQLSLIKAQSGIEGFEIVCNETNNGDEDIQLNRMNGRIVVIPTKMIEFIAIDFIVTNSGVQFV